MIFCFFGVLAHGNGTQARGVHVDLLSPSFTVLQMDKLWPGRKMGAHMGLLQGRGRMFGDYRVGKIARGEGFATLQLPKRMKGTIGSGKLHAGKVSPHYNSQSA